MDPLDARLAGIQAASVAFYDADAARRERKPVPGWKNALRLEVLEAARSFRRPRLLDLGSGVGRDLEFFSTNGVDAIGVDISPVSVAIARERGLNAEVMDLHHVSLPSNSFEVLYSMNGLVHIPGETLHDVLKSLSSLLVADGWFFTGAYGGSSYQKYVTMRPGLGGEVEGAPGEGDRFFASYAFEDYCARLSAVFDVVESKCLKFPRQEFHWFKCRVC